MQEQGESLVRHVRKRHVVWLGAIGAPMVAEPGILKKKAIRFVIVLTIHLLAKQLALPWLLLIS